MDKFTRCAWQPGPGGLPILQECRDWFVGRVLDRLDLGDHVGYLLEPVAAHRGTEETYLSFQQAMSIEPGQPA